MEKAESSESSRFMASANNTWVGVLLGKSVKRICDHFIVCQRETCTFYKPVTSFWSEYNCTVVGCLVKMIPIEEEEDEERKEEHSGKDL